MWVLCRCEGEATGPRSTRAREDWDCDREARCQTCGDYKCEPRRACDGGAEHFAETVKAIKRIRPKRIELLVPDFLGDRAAMDVVLMPVHVVAHNMVRLYRRVRPQAIYQPNLDRLRHIAEREDVICKTGMMLGLGETDEEVEDVMWTIRDTGCEILSLEPFLSPTVKHLAVEQ